MEAAAAEKAVAMEAAAIEKAARMEAKIAKMSKPSSTSPRLTVDIDKRLDQVSLLLLLLLSLHLRLRV